MCLKSLSHYVPGLVLEHLLVAGLCCLAATFLLLRWMGQRQAKQKIERARRQREQVLSQMQGAVDRYWEQHPEVHSEVLSLSLIQLAGKMRDGSLSPESALYTYMGKALEVNRELNCLTDFLPECEAQLQEIKKQKEKGLLYGVPVSLKDNVGYKGHESHCGLVHYLGMTDLDDSVVVQVLKKQGAIPFVKTNIPQSMINFDCSNSIFGQTLNPHNHKKTCGGSTGGEGALIAGGGSILGIGTDILGSIRMPCSFCGVCGLKPSGDRLSGHGCSSPVHGMSSAVMMPGPMARDVDSLALCMKALLCDDMFRLDPTVPPIPFRDEIYHSTKPLTIGYYDTDGYFLPPPAVRRAIQETKNHLEEVGHKLVPFTPPRIEYALNELCVRGFFADGASSLTEKFDKDIVDSNLKQQMTLWRLPTLAKSFMAFFMKPVSPRIAGHVNAHCGISSVKNFWKHNAALKDYCHEFVTEWRRMGLDVLLCPMLGPAFNIGSPGKLFAGFTFTMLYNILNFPCGIVPVTTVTAEDEEEMKHYKGYCNDPWDQELPKCVEGGLGLPVTVQCVALRWQEELCLHLMKEVEKVSSKMK